MNSFKVPVLGFAAYSGTGKTTLLVRLIPLLKQQGVRVAMVKHAHHEFDIDIPGKDSYELRKAGAEQMLAELDAARRQLAASQVQTRWVATVDEREALLDSLEAEGER